MRNDQFKRLYSELLDPKKLESPISISISANKYDLRSDLDHYFKILSDLDPRKKMGSTFRSQSL